MNISKYWLYLIVALAAINFAACSTVSGFFPDKEKDYHYHKELPELELPPDLQAKVDKQQTPGANKFVKQQKKSEGDTYNSAPVVVRWVKYDEGSVRIQMESSLKRAWPIVGKALSHNMIEITDRNRSEAVYFVQFDPEVEKYEDGSIADEFGFFFGDNPRQEKEYHLRLAVDRNLTEVMVTDDKDKPLSEGDGIKLLNLVYETIKASQEEKAQK